MVVAAAAAAVAGRFVDALSVQQLRVFDVADCVAVARVFVVGDDATGLVTTTANDDDVDAVAVVAATMIAGGVRVVCVSLVAVRSVYRPLADDALRRQLLHVVGVDVASKWTADTCSSWAKVVAE